MHPRISSHQRSYVPNSILLVLAVEDDDDVLVAVFGSYRRRYNVVGDQMQMRPSETAASATLSPYRISLCEYGNQQLLVTQYSWPR